MRAIVLFYLLLYVLSLWILLFESVDPSVPQVVCVLHTAYQPIAYCALRTGQLRTAHCVTTHYVLRTGTLRTAYRLIAYCAPRTT